MRVDIVKTTPLAAIAVMLAGCGTGGTGTNEPTPKLPEPKPPERVRVTLSAPREIEAKAVVVKGTVDPPTASVRIEGQSVRVGPDGYFRDRVALPDTGVNTLIATGTAPGRTEGEDRTTIYRQLNPREAARRNQREAAAETRDAPAPTPKPEPEPQSAGITVPNVVGQNHQYAQDTMQAAGLYGLQEQDCTGQGRLLLWDRNWVVVKQDPPAGTTVDENTTITLCSKKQGE